MKHAVGFGQYVSKPFKGIARGIREGFEANGYKFTPIELVSTPDTLEEMKQKILKAYPSIIFGQCWIDRGNHVPQDVLNMLYSVKAEIGCKLVYQEGDFKDISERPDVDLSGIDLLAFNQEYQWKEHSKKWNIPIEKIIMFPFAGFAEKVYRRKLPKRMGEGERLNFPLVFIGSTGEQYPFRRKVLEALKEYVTILPNDKFSGADCYKIGTKIYMNSTISLSVDYVQDILHFSSDRQFIIIGSGGFCLCHRAKGLDKVFKDGEHLIFFDTPEEAVEKYLYWLNNTEGRDRIRRKGFDFVQKYHTWTNRVSDLIKILNGEQDHITFKLDEINEQ